MKNFFNSSLFESVFRFFLLALIPLFFYGFILFQERYVYQKPEYIVNEVISPKFPQGQVLKIELDWYGVVEENGIGDDWRYYSNIDGNNLIINSKAEIELSGKSSIKLYSGAVEEDPNHDDEGEKIFEIDPQFIEQIKESVAYYTIDVEVYESHGSGAGNTAICQFGYRFELKDSESLD